MYYSPPCIQFFSRHCLVSADPWQWSERAPRERDQHLYIITPTTYSYRTHWIERFHTLAHKHNGFLIAAHLPKERDGIRGIWLATPPNFPQVGCWGRCSCFVWYLALIIDRDLWPQRYPPRHAGQIMVSCSHALASHIIKWLHNMKLEPDRWHHVCMTVDVTMIKLVTLPHPLEGSSP